MLSAARCLAAASGTNLGSQWVRLFSIGTTALPSGRAGAPAAGRGQTTEFGGGDGGSVGGEGGLGGIRSEVARVIGKTNTCKKVGSLRTYNCVGKKRDHPEGLPEICVIGRTNAGKSSLLNHLCDPPPAPPPAPSFTPTKNPYAQTCSMHALRILPSIFRLVSCRLANAHRQQRNIFSQLEPDAIHVSQHSEFSQDGERLIEGRAHV
jgi:hypothetical protein